MRLREKTSEEEKRKEEEEEKITGDVVIGFSPARAGRSKSRRDLPIFSFPNVISSRTLTLNYVFYIRVNISSLSTITSICESHLTHSSRYSTSQHTLTPLLALNNKHSDLSPLFFLQEGLCVLTPNRIPHILLTARISATTWLDYIETLRDLLNNSTITIRLRREV